MGLVLMTTITENSYVETAVLTQLLAGQALNFDIGGDASLTLYEVAGVDAQTAEELYPEELLAIAGLQLLQEQLANEYFYDEQVALSPAFKALVSIAVGAFVAPAIVGAAFPGLASATGTFMSALGTGLEAFTATVIVESLDGAVSGDFDIGDILADAAFSGVTAGLTSGINIDILGITSETNLELFNSLLGDLGNGNLSIANILDGALDNIISNGLSSAVYGTDFTSQFGLSMVRTVVNLAMADVQFEIGELGEGIDNWEGSFSHMLLHGLTGCAAAEATGASCASGAAAAVTQSIYSRVVQDSQPSRDNYNSDAAFESAYKKWRDNTVQTAGVLGALAGYVFSGGEAQNVTTGDDIATSGIANNYLYHAEAQEREQARGDCQAGDQAACQRVAELDALDQQRDQHLIDVCGADIHGTACKSAFEDLTHATFSYHSEPPSLYETQQDYLDALGPEAAAGLQAEYTQMNKMLGILSADPELRQAAEVVLRSYFVENNGAVMRMITGIGEAGADAVYGMHSLAHTIVTDPDQLRQAVAAIVDDPSLLPEAMWEPFKTRLDAGDIAGASGYALVAALELVSGTKGTINLVKGASTNVVDILRLRRTAGDSNAINRRSPWSGVDTGSKGVGSNVPDDIAGWVRGADGSSLPIRKNAQGLPDWERYLRDNASVTNTSGALNPSSVRFTQNSIGAKFSDGRSVDDLIIGLRNGSVDPSSLPPIRTFEANGQLFSLDNRRLYAYRQAGVDVPTVPATAAEIARDARFKFSTINGGQDIAVRGQ
ncbi:DUF6862 domain-containing protein [Pseudovibrio sp. Ad26]|uniref:DUF6862 domain-containing protein n=1 Tax=Pseudovibrio sp. Ad26 TaxID=989410 RepID=UPI0007AED188|nr:DUF637 domain-containing protein [Pseudovibrio sp. Ad26]KZL12451.1 hypothetical protein PsAD26_02524 [Pseudovibrio sp. Ad26]